MVDDYLTVTKIESGEIAREMDIKKDRVTPNHIVQRLIADLEYQRRHHNITIENKIVDATISVIYVCSAFREYSSPVLDNAIKFSRPRVV